MPPLTYKGAGVDIDEADRFVESIRADTERTRRPEVIGGIGGFGGLCALPERPGGWREPVLVAGTDGVGTKLKVAIETGRHRGVGIDLVAMCVNDILAVGAEPLFFLDYFATGRLDRAVGAELVAGIADGCVDAGCALLGGETAEMPGFYPVGDYDLAGFAVGVVERREMLDPADVRPGDVLIGLPSTGLHSNGYSLARRALEVRGLGWDDRPPELGGASVADALLEPTRIYARAAAALRAAGGLRSLAHITGGGIPGNLPRALPQGVTAELDSDSWSRPPVFDVLAAADISLAESYRAFNMGLGLIAVVSSRAVGPSLAALEDAGERGQVVGRLAASEGAARTRISGVSLEEDSR